MSETPSSTMALDPSEKSVTPWKRREASEEQPEWIHTEGNKSGYDSNGNWQ
jgi:hypothetical protein